MLNDDVVLDSIEHVVKYAARGFEFGYYSLEDVQQYARLEALKAVPLFRPERAVDGDEPQALRNFLFTHVKRRLLNLVRDKYKRSDAPCKRCHAGEPHRKTKACARHTDWKERNQNRINLIWPVDIDVVPDACAIQNDGPDDALELKELFAKLDQQLPAELAEIYHKHMSGGKVKKVDLERLEVAIKELIYP